MDHKQSMIESLLCNNDYYLISLFMEYLLHNIDYSVIHISSLNRNIRAMYRKITYLRKYIEITKHLYFDRKLFYRCSNLIRINGIINGKISFTIPKHNFICNLICIHETSLNFTDHHINSITFKELYYVVSFINILRIYQLSHKTFIKYKNKISYKNNQQAINELELGVVKHGNNCHASCNCLSNYNTSRYGILTTHHYNQLKRIYPTIKRNIDFLPCNCNI